jgi:nucleotide-binding universal stress UspA family protein
MECKALRRWCSPQRILIVTDMSEAPGRTLALIRQAQATEARVLVVHVIQTHLQESAGRSCPFLLPRFTQNGARTWSDDMQRALLWADSLSNVSVLKSAPPAEIPALAESLKVDRVVLTKLGDSVARPRAGKSVEQDLMTSLRVPLCFMSGVMGAGLWSSKGIRRVLLPISLRSNVGLHLRFACKLAQLHQARLTVLHAFGGRGTNERPWERTPVAVEAQLPISDLKQEGIICPMEIAVCEGDPGRAILNFDATNQHDLIIMGGPGRETPPHIYRNGAVHDVIAEARCPVVVLGLSLDATSGFVRPVSQPDPGVNQFTA